ncbi:HNH endonuclease [Comamonas thiooxydans]|uniref:HNH endonuclease n=1 Tax=Comamonas thiooxydans TaxID=363952 RepID=UPI000B40A8AB|nr:HNH endonuclease [Comamonas thiooxydans]
MQTVLTLDRGGRPSRWASWEDAITYIAKGLVQWHLGDETVYRGGMSRLTGGVSEIAVPNIICVKNEVYDDRVGLTNSSLFFRDGMTCCYCNRPFHRGMLSREHIVPVSGGGPDTFMNCVTCCKPCNNLKGSRSLKDCGFEMHYYPYVPSKTELLLNGTKQMAQDQMKFLWDAIPRNSPMRSRRDHPVHKLLGIH